MRKASDISDFFPSFDLTNPFWISLLVFVFETQSCFFAHVWYFKAVFISYWKIVPEGRGEEVGHSNVFGNVLWKLMGRDCDLLSSYLCGLCHSFSCISTACSWLLFQLYCIDPLQPSGVNQCLLPLMQVGWGRAGLLQFSWAWMQAVGGLQVCSTSLIPLDQLVVRGMIFSRSWPACNGSSLVI